MSKIHINTMLIGAGEAGVELVNDLMRNPNNACRIRCIIDDDKLKWGTEINGIPVLGGRDKISDAVHRFEISDVILAIPSADAQERKKILDICQDTGCRLRTLPSLFQLVDPSVKIKLVRDVDIEDLLGREESHIDPSLMSGYITGKRILITGGGGSIGSELCRQIAKYAPSSLIIFDSYENCAYAIQQELLAKYSALNLEVFIGSIKDISCLRDMFRRVRPEIVFHAAAHKHVPLMENNPHEAIKNNVFGTLNLINTSNEFNVEKFTLISTDKAVNPSNIMGASKRLCEMLLQSMAGETSTQFSAVRFGNVLGSNGSVIPLFKKQIADGGPVTVTHPEISRFFMTIPEAVSLVLASGSMASGGEIFILDMGDPVKILDMANNLIRLSGFTPEEDIKIVFTGLRPGEKMYEELALPEEGICRTKINQILVTTPSVIDKAILMTQIRELEILVEDRNSDIRYAVSRIVRSYIPGIDPRPS